MSTVTVPQPAESGGLAPDPAVTPTKSAGAKKLPIILGVEHVRRFCAHFLIIIIPRPRPFGPALAIIIMRINRNAVSGPESKAAFDPIAIIRRRLRLIRRDGIAQHSRPAFALFIGNPVETLDLFIGQVGENAGH